MDVEMMQSAQAGVLRLNGSWTVEHADELKRDLLKALDNLESIVIDLEGPKDLDLSSMQLFCSAHRTSLGLGKRLAFHEQRPEAFKRIVRDAGLERTIGCHKDLHECLWTGGCKS